MDTRGTECDHLWMFQNITLLQEYKQDVSMLHAVCTTKNKEQRKSYVAMYRHEFCLFRSETL